MKLIKKEKTIIENVLYFIGCVIAYMMLTYIMSETIYIVYKINIIYVLLESLIIIILSMILAVKGIGLIWTLINDIISN